MISYYWCIISTHDCMGVHGLLLATLCRSIALQASDKLGETECRTRI